MATVDVARGAITDGYLAAVGLERSDPSLDFLSALTRHHVGEFAFSSIGPRLCEPMPLDLPSLYDRLVVRRRGGYCFENDGLFLALLTFPFPESSKRPRMRQETLSDANLLGTTPTRRRSSGPRGGDGLVLA
ncbi:MAG: arylamine N-acetyltransferase [Actinobacteria bacterium]|nr:arylamine N-acetyltransferase [Actinomycetota bacterium]